MISRWRWSMRRSGWGRALSPLVLAVALLPWVGPCIWNYTHGLLYRDSKMFLYIAWSVAQGDRLYETVAMPDGPLVCVLHLLLGGASAYGEHAFRVADLALHTTVAMAMGALLVPPRSPHPVASRLAWGVTVATLWLVFLFHWGYPQSTQRESYYALLECLGLVLFMASGDLGSRGSRWALVLGGLAIGLPVFGKPTCAIVMAGGLGALAMDRPTPLRARLARLALAGSGLALGAVLMFGFVAVFGSLRGALFWQVDYVRVFYRHLDRLYLAGTLIGMPRDLAATAVGCVLGGGLAVRARLLPPRALGLAAAPALALVGAISQERGWEYHYIPVAASAQVLLALLLVRVWSGGTVHASVAAPSRQGVVALCVAVVVLLVQSAAWAWTSPWLDPAERYNDNPRLAGVREAAAFVAGRTGPQDRVFYYGGDPGLLLFARRRSATPYIATWFALQGPRIHYRSDLDGVDRSRIDSMRAKLSDDLCQRMLIEQPAAIVVSDDWCKASDCARELQEICGDPFRRLVRDQYTPPTSIRTQRIYLRRAD